MQDRDHLCSVPLPSIDGLYRPTPARFRVMARCRNGVKCLVSLTAYREDAVELAERFRDVAIARTETPARGKKQERDGLAAIVVEEWIGTPTVGRWKYLDPQNGGFCHVFRAFAGNGRFRLKSGETVDCVLLPEKTRKGGWKAKVVGRGLIGPVTNTKDIPRSAMAGQQVSLRVGAISLRGKHIQFDWLPDSDKVSRDVMAQATCNGDGPSEAN